MIPGNTASAGKKPTTPVIGSASPGNGNASAPFTASTYIGKGTITYTATSSPGGFAASGASPITVSGLSNGVAYTFTVVGLTDYGVSSDVSAASNAVTPFVPTTTTTVAPCPPPGTHLANACVGLQLNYVLADGACGSYLSPVGEVNGYCGCCPTTTTPAPTTTTTTVPPTTTTTVPPLPGCVCCRGVSVYEEQCMPQGWRHRYGTSYNGSCGASGSSGTGCSGACSGCSCPVLTSWGAWTNTMISCW